MKLDLVHVGSKLIPVTFLIPQTVQSGVINILAAHRAAEFTAGVPSHTKKPLPQKAELGSRGWLTERPLST